MWLVKDMKNCRCLLIRWRTSYIYRLWGFCVLLEDLLGDNGLLLYGVGCGEILPYSLIKVLPTVL